MKFLAQLGTPHTIHQVIIKTNTKMIATQPAQNNRKRSSDNDSEEERRMLEEKKNQMSNAFGILKEMCDLSRADGYHHPLIWAVKKNKLDVAKTFFDYGKEFAALHPKEQLKVDFKYETDAEFMKNTPPLVSVAAANNNLDMIKLLVSQGFSLAGQYDLDLLEEYEHIEEVKHLVR